MVNEETPLLRASVDSEQRRHQRLYTQRSLRFILTWILLITLVSTAATDHLWSRSVISSVVIGVLLRLPLALGFLLAVHGMYLRNRGLNPFDGDACRRDGGRFVSTADGRIVEYFCWGSDSKDATVTILCQGQCLTGRSFNQFLYPQAVLEKLNVKAISPSFPGHGYSDMMPYRRIAHWPADDLEPILAAENVKKCMVQGMSYGTSHAMATGAHFGPATCIAIGLNVPYLPKDVAREFEFRTYADMVLNDEWLQSPLISPIFSLLAMVWGFVTKVGNFIREGKTVVSEDPSILKALEDDIKRGAIRGVNGQVFELLNGDTNQVWQDPRLIQTKCICVWYAADDSLSPPEHGKWLADHFRQKPGNIRCENISWGHFSYGRKVDRDNGIMTKALLELLASS